MKALLEKKADVLGLLVLVGIIAAVVCFAVFYYDAPPSPTAPKCLAGEAPILTSEWWCVPARKP